MKPHSFIVMFPKSLQKKARPVTKEERRHTILMYATLYPAILIWMILSTYQAGINGFWPIFWTSYIEMMFLSLGDLFFLDYLLLKKTGKRLHADGVKDDPFYEPKNELLNLGLPEHLILWPVLYCPIVGFIAAVILNTAGFYIIFNLVGAVLTWITGHESFFLLAKSGASLGVGVTFLAVAHVCSKETK